jgi:hypothetical protein
MNIKERIIFLSKKYPNGIYSELLESNISIDKLIKIKKEKLELADLKGESLDQYKNDILLLNNLSKDYIKEKTLKIFKRKK